MVFFLLFFQRLYFSLLGDKDKKKKFENYHQKLLLLSPDQAG